MPSNHTAKAISAAVLFLILYSAAPSSGQIKVHTILDVEKGMVQSTVRSIFKDDEGYLWFGTNLGVSRWDGLSFANFSPADGLPGHIIYSIAQDSRGRIFFGTSSGVAYYRDGKFTSIITSRNYSRVSVRSIIEADDRRILLGTDAGIFCLDENSDSMKIFDRTTLGRDILTGYKSAAGDIYFGTNDNEIIIYGRSGKQSYHLPKSVADAGIHSIGEDEKGNIVFGLYNSIMVQKGNSLESYALSGRTDCGRINAIGRADNGNLWICTENAGAFLWNERVLDKIDRDNGFGDNNIMSVLRAADGTTYFGISSGGVGIVNRYGIQVYNEKTGLTHNNITTICRSNDGAFYFGTRENGVSVVRGASVRMLKMPDEICCEQILKIFKDKAGDLYFGTNAGVNIRSGNSLKILNVRAGLPGDIILDICGGQDGGIYIATSKGLGILKDGNISSLKVENGLTDDFITSVVVSRRGTVYAGTFFGGVNIISENRITPLTAKDGLLGNSVLSLYLDRNMNLWVGTSNGLNLVIGGKVVKSFTTKDGLSSNTINGITEDAGGRLFLATNKGVNVLDLSGRNVSVHTLLTEDGIIGEECNIGAVYRDDDGYIWIGTIRGAVRFDPEKIIPNEIPPRIKFGSVLVNNENLRSFDEITPAEFSYNENYFTFNFNALNLTSPARVKYGYRMLGLDKDWIITSQNSVQYANLAEGRYRFQVRARNEWGIWSPATEYSFVIVPPFWRTWWFIIAAVISVIGAAAYILTKRVKRMLAYERLRLKIAADLHDNIGAGLTEISIISEILKTKREGEEGEKYLDEIAVKSRQLIESMRDIVWIVNPKQDSLHDLILRLEDSFAEILDYKGISFETENLESLRKVALPMDYRQHLYLIFKEAINNSIKYSRCTRLLLKAGINDKILELVLSDNGIGMNGNKIHRGNGITNMHDRACKIGGVLNISSGESGGTTITYSGRI